MTAVAVEITSRPPATRAPLPVEITERPLGDTELELIGDLDKEFEVTMCSCNASDDNPY